MDRIRILDCTLRDGGHVNDFNFGFEKIKAIIAGLETSNLDIIEIGFLKNGEYEKNRSVFEYVEQAESVLPTTTTTSNFSLMIRPDWYDIDKLSPSNKIDIIRFAFYWEDIELTLRHAEAARKLGYKVFLNPVNITGYDDEGLQKLTTAIAEFNPYGVSIVDTFGCLTNQRLIEIYAFFEQHIPQKTIIGLHLHENLSLSLSLALKFHEISQPKREIVIDSSVLGMGRIPGNLPTELLVGYLNENGTSKYDMAEILNVAYELIRPIKSSFTWGYSPIYALSAYLAVHRSYPEFFEKHGLNYQETNQALKLVSHTESKGKFDPNLADRISRSILDKAR